MKLMEKMRQKKLGNKGFTLVELIIVIAIMAILLGIVGTQVVPYLNRAREAKDLQIINSFCTAGVSAYSMNAEDFASIEATDGNLTVYFSTAAPEEGVAPTVADTWLATIKELTGYSYADLPTDGTTVNTNTLNKAMNSKKGKTISDVAITIDFSTGKVTAQGLSKKASASDKVLDPVEAIISSK